MEDKVTGTSGTSGRPRMKKQPITSAKLSIADKVKSLKNQGFDENRIAAMLMIQKSLVKDILG